MAFLGAGISHSYGAISWDQLTVEISQKALAKLEDVLSVNDEKRKLSPQLLDRIRRMRDRLIVSGGQDKRRATSEYNLTQLELFRLAFDLAEEAARERGVGVGDDRSSSFHEAIADLTKDDRAVAAKLAFFRLREFSKGLGIQNEADKAWLERLGNKNQPGPVFTTGVSSADGEAVRFFNYQALYNVSTFDRLLEVISSKEVYALLKEDPDCPGNPAKSEEDALGELKEFIEHVKKITISDALRAGRDASTGGLPPDRRSGFSSIFAYIAIRLQYFEKGVELGALIWRHIGGLKEEASSFPGQWLSNDASTASLSNTAADIRPRSDPILHLYEDLKFWRFLTTNYDFEVERMLETLNYPRGTLSDRPDILDKPFQPNISENGKRRQARSFYGDQARSDVLSANSIAELIDIATQSHDVGAQIMHLHGRADLPETIIAAESDYQDVYLRQKTHSRSFDHALHIVFSGNPILFIGSSLREQDLQRPLREFTSNQPHDQRELFALMPALKKAKDLDSDKIENYMRYGVRTLFYGEKKPSAQKQIRDAEKNYKRHGDKERDVRHLPRKIGALEVSLNKRMENLQAIASTIQSLIDVTKIKDIDHDRIVKSADKMRSIIVGAEFSRALGVIFCGADPHMALPVDHAALRGALSSINALAQDIGEDELVTLLGDRVRRMRLKASLLLIKDHLTQLEGKIISAALVWAVLDLSELRRRWWNDVRREPEVRVTADAARIRFTQKLPSLYVQTRQQVLSPRGFVSLQAETANRFYSLLMKNFSPNGMDRPGRVYHCFSEVGSGKGSFYHLLTRRVFSDAVQRLHKNERAPYSHFFFINLSHTLEFSSILVSFGNFLKTLCVDLLTEDDSMLSEYRRRRGHLAFIEYAVGRLVDPPHKIDLAHRALIVIAGFDRLVDIHGLCHTVEIERLCAQLGKLALHAAPIDTVLISRAIKSLPFLLQGSKPVGDDDLPVMLPYSNNIVDLCVKQDLEQYEASTEKHHYSTFLIGSVQSSAADASAAALKSGADEDSHVQAAFNTAKSSILCAHDLPIELKKIFESALDCKWAGLLQDCVDECGSKALSIKLNWISKIAPAQGVSWGEDERKRFRQACEARLRLLDVADRLRPLILALKPEVTLDRFYEVVSDRIDWGTMCWSLGEIDRVKHECLSVLLAYSEDIHKTGNAQTINGYISASTQFFENLRKLHQEMRGNVFLHNLVHKLLFDNDHAWGIRDENPITPYRRKARWMEELIHALEATSNDLLPVRIIEAVLAQYGVKSENAEGKVDYESRIDFLTLKHLSFFGFPVEAAVLMRAPELKTYLEYCCRYKHLLGPGEESLHARINAEPSILVDIMVRIMQRSLKRLLERQLVGVVAPRRRASVRDEVYPGAEKGAAAIAPYGECTPIWLNVLAETVSDGVFEDQEAYTQPSDEDFASLRNGYRFVLHPAMKTFLTRQMAFRTPEQGYTNTFVFSIYAAQPTDVALLATDVQETVDQFLDEIVQAWRVYPITPIQELLEETAEGPAAQPDQIDSVYREAIEGAYSFRAKTARGFLARASADMPLCYRAAYGVLRQLRPFSVLVRMESKFGATAISPPQSPFDETNLRIKRLIEGMISSQMARKKVAEISTKPEDDTSFDRKIYRPFAKKGDWECRHPVNTFGPLDEPEPALYPHEVAWLWNERGVIALAQGKLYDAIPYFDFALKLMAKHEGKDQNGPGAARIRLNLAFSQIERGNLRRAATMLKAVKAFSRDIAGLDSDEPQAEPARRHIVLPIAHGFLGLIDHLSGDLQAAKEKYLSALAPLEKLSRNRACAIFRKYLADLHLAMGDTDAAEDELDRAIFSAETMMQQDQLHMIRLSQVRIWLQKAEKDMHGRSASMIREVLEHARAMNLHRLECEALYYDGKLKILQGEFDLAGKFAADSVAIATRYGMKLRRISALLMLGEALCRNGDEVSGRKVLEDSGIAAQKLGYQLAVERKQDILLQLAERYPRTKIY